MKRLLLILLMVASVFRAEAYHWSPNSGPYANTMTVIGVIQIDGEEQNVSDLEIGVFCGDECRGREMPVYIAQMNRYMLFLTIFGNNGDALSFRLYDHSINEELVLNSLNTMTFATNATLGTVATPYVFEFETISYSIEVTANPTLGGIVTGAGIYNHGETVTLTATANTGYHFVNWTLGGSVVSTEATYSFTATEAGTYIANFELNSYEITATANPTEGGTVAGAGTYTHGSTVTLIATANTGYHFVNWTKSGTVVSTDTTYSFSVTEASAFVANFELNSYVITATANPTEGGTVTGAGTYTHGSTATLTATANEGYTFINWTMGNEVVSTEAAYSFEVIGPASYVANFELNSYEITATANPEAGGTMEGAGTYNHFETCTLTATANEGYTFLNWTKNGEVVTTEATYSFEVTEPGDYVANFELNTYEITAVANPEAGGTVTGAGTYNHFETCTLVATANEGYTFLNWTKDGEEVSAEATYSFTVTETAAFVANFELSSITQTTNFVVGWTWWSTCIETDETDVLNQLKTGLGASGQVIKSQTASTMHLGNNWVGTLAMTNEGGYMVKSNSAVTVDITGPATTPEDHPITLNPGWTWIGYPCTEQMTVAEALANHVPQPNDVIKTQNASAVYMLGSWRGSLTLTPGVGCMYKSNAGSNITLTYATPTGRGDVIEPEVETHWMANHHAYPTNMTVLAAIELDGEELNREDYEVAAFVNGECRGSVRLMNIEPLNRHFALLTISGEEAAELRFALYNTETGEEYHNAIETLTYEADAVVGSPEAPFVVRFRNTMGMDESEIRFRVYPNPVSNMLNIEGVNGEYSYALFNGMGQMVVSGNAMGNTQINVNGMAKGVYFLRLNTGTQVRMEKVVVE